MIPIEERIEKLEAQLKELKAEIKPKFKKGDFVFYSENNGYNECVIILDFIDMNKGINGIKYFVQLNTITSYLHIGENIASNWETERFATEKEKQLLLDKLHENGKDWDAEKMEIVDYKWKPKVGDRYYLPGVVTDSLNLFSVWHDDKSDNIVFERNIVCKTKEEAIEKANKMLEAIK